MFDGESFSFGGGETELTTQLARCETALAESRQRVTHLEAQNALLRQKIDLLVRRGIPGAIQPLHFPPKAKRVIHLCMAGGPSHLESFDWKPTLRELHGKDFPESLTRGQRLAQLQNTPLKARGPFVDFAKHGQSKGDAVHYVGNPEGVCQSTQRQVIEEVNRMNGMLAEEKLDPEIQTRIAQYELAFRMQTSVPELPDFAREPKSVLDLYGIEPPGDGSFASNCLMARRLAERSVRFIQLYHRAWDHHGDIESNMPAAAKDVDQVSAALVQDLKQRGMLDDTLVIWGGEFGRTPMGQGSGRDHHIKAFSIGMAGGGVKPGVTWGNTDDLGYSFLEDGQDMNVHDLHATMLKLCGVDHTRLTVRYQGRDFRLTDVHGRIIEGICA